MTFADRLAAMFPDDPMLPAMVAACERDDRAYAVYLRCKWLHALWTHPRGDTKQVRKFLRNPVWPARALALCHSPVARDLLTGEAVRYEPVPAPSWVTAWTVDLSTGRAKPPGAADHQRAARVISAVGSMASPKRGLPMADQVAIALALNATDASRMSARLNEFLDTLDMPRAGK